MTWRSPLSPPTMAPVMSCSLVSRRTPLYPLPFTRMILPLLTYRYLKWALLIGLLRFPL